MLGFVNGLAIVIFLAQLTQFKVTGSDGGKEWMSGFPLVLMLGLVVLTMLIIHFFPKLTKTIPAPLAGIALVAALVIALGLDVPRVGDLASIQGGLPAFHIPQVPLTMETLQIIIPYAFILAAIGLIESLLTLNLVGEITGRSGGASQECLAQGAANNRHRILRWHGRLRDDRSIHDQREVRWSNPPVGHRRSAVPAGLHHAGFRSDRTDPPGCSGRRDVHGRDRHICLAQPCAYSAKFPLPTQWSSFL